MKTIWNLPKIDFIPFAYVEESRPAMLVTSTPAWSAVSDQMQLPVAWQVDVTEPRMTQWDKLLSKRGAAAREPQVVYAVGGGLIADAAKHMALQLGLPLIMMPTVLSVDAFFTPTSGVREAGCVRYVETKAAERVIIDFNVIAAAPAGIRAAGICDVLSIATGCWDWKFAEERGRNRKTTPFVQYVYDQAQAILRGALDCAEAAGHGDEDGLKQLLDCLCLEVQLTNQIGHARPEEGGEHFFAYSVENAIGIHPHGDLVGPGIIQIARLQGQDTIPLEQALRACSIPLTRIPEVVIRQTLQDLPDYVRRHGLDYGIAHEIKLDE